MSKIKRSDEPSAVFHITGRVNWQKWHLMHHWGCELFWRQVRIQSRRFGVRAVAGVIMSNHFHLVAQSPGPKQFRLCTTYLTPCRHRRPYPDGHCNATAIGQFMREVRRNVSRVIQRHHGVTGRFWERRFHARRIDDAWDMMLAMLYDHRNPVRAGMVKEAHEYEWSTSGWWRDGDASRTCRPHFDRLPFGLSVAHCRGLIQRKERSRELQAIIDDLRRQGIWWYAPEGREELARRGFGEHTLAAPLPQAKALTQESKTTYAEPTGEVVPA